MKSEKALNIIADRDAGMKYREIAEKYGVSHQYVAQLCGKSNPRYFKIVGERCIYPNLRKWMNDNKVSYNELLRRMGQTPYPEMCSKLSTWTSGKNDPPKVWIDRMIAATGLPYEVLFAKEN